MPLEVGVWRLDGGLRKVEPSRLAQESVLEDCIEQDVSLIRPDLWVIGRQVLTDYGHYIDLLAIDAQGNLVVLELKRDKTPREVVAQTLDYGCWVKNLTRDDVAGIYQDYQRKHRPQAPEAFEAAFAERFEGSQLPETVNESHELLIVAAELDESTERIIEYLSGFDVPVNAVFFRAFKDDDREYLTRAWLLDPAEQQAKVEEGQARKKGREPWNSRDFYVSFGHSRQRLWEEARQYGFISAGGGTWYTRTLSQLRIGHRVFACIPGKGYVGVGTVIKEAAPARDFTINVDGEERSILRVGLQSEFENVDDLDKSEVLVGIEWERTKDAESALWEKGMFANQNSACKLRSRFTIERLLRGFGLDE